MKYTLNLGNAILDFFSNLSPVAAACLIVGITLIVTEIFRQTRGMLAVIGTLALLAASVLCIVVKPSPETVFMLVLIFMLTINGAYILRLVFYKRQWLTRSPNLAESAGISDSAKDYYFLLNLEGTAVTDIKHTGRIMINEIEFDVVSREGKIPANTRVRVIEVEGKRIVVKPVIR